MVIIFFGSFSFSLFDLLESKVLQSSSKFIRRAARSLSTPSNFFGDWGCGIVGCGGWESDRFGMGVFWDSARCWIYRDCQRRYLELADQVPSSDWGLFHRKHFCMGFHGSQVGCGWSPFLLHNAQLFQCHQGLSRGLLHLSFYFRLRHWCQLQWWLRHSCWRLQKSRIGRIFLQRSWVLLLCSQSGGNSKGLGLGHGIFLKMYT